MLPSLRFIVLTLPQFPQRIRLIAGLAGVMLLLSFLLPGMARRGESSQPQRPRRIRRAVDADAVGRGSAGDRRAAGARGVPVAD